MTPNQVEKLLTLTLPNNLSVLIKGAPGVGKTSVIKQVVLKNLGWDLLISHPVISDPTDYKGLPALHEGEAKFLPYSDLKQLIHAEKPLVWFVDDLGQASVEVQKALMQLLLERRIGEHKMSDHVRIVAATNDRQHGAGVTTILQTVLSRFKTIVNMDVDLDSWVDWAIANGMPAKLVGFMKFQPNKFNVEGKLSKELKNSVCPRTLESVGDFLNLNDGKGIPSDLFVETIAGAVGDGFAEEFKAYCDTVDQLPDLDHLLKFPMKAPVPNEKNPSARYAIAMALNYRVDLENVENALTYIDRLPTEFGIIMMQGVTKRKPELKNSKALVDWIIKHERDHN